MSRQRGLSLIELVVAMALFALVATFGAQALRGLLRQADGLDRHAAAAANLDRAASQIGADLQAAIPMLFYPPGDAQPRSALTADASGFALSTAGQPMLGGTEAALHRVEYRLDGGVLVRAAWPSLIPAEPGARHDAMIVARDVTGLRLRTHWPRIGWIDGARPPLDSASAPTAGDADRAGPAPEVYSSALPDAVEVVLTLDGIGDVPIRRALR
ncbi:type II secretion system protein GspJ [Citreimonas sp.]|uniref:type II secretion system protein GspJ n=1 Tax=Citreimonas sp. TaxID=3036715 RepID=UPI0035C84338